MPTWPLRVKCRLSNCLDAGQHYDPKRFALGFEMAIERAIGHARGLGQPINPQTAIAFAAKQLPGGFYDPGSRLLFVLDTVAHHPAF